MKESSGQARRLDARDVAERAAVRAGQHAVLADLLGAYADGELPAESAARVEAHLVGCTRCRRDLDAQIALRDRLATEVVLPASTALRDRILAATAAIPAPVLPDVVSAAPAAAAGPGAHVVRDLRPRRWRVVAAVVACVALAGMIGAARWRGHAAVTIPPVAAELGVSAGRVPLLAAALADYRQVTAGDLPGRARDLDAVRGAVGFPVEPLRTAGLRLLGAWTTTLDGEPAAVLAYRHGDGLVLQYLVSESLFFRHSAIRAAAAAHRPLTATDGSQAVVAWPESASGALLVSDGTAAQLAGAVPPLLFRVPSAVRGPAATGTGTAPGP